MVAADYPEARLIRNACNMLYAEANNIGARAATGEFVCLLNSDTEVMPGALERLCAFLAANIDYGAASPQLVWPDGRVQPACQRFPGLAEALCASKFWRRTAWGQRIIDRAEMRDFDHLQSIDVDQPPGACMVMRRKEYLDFGGLDPRLSLFFNDVDLCLRLWQRGRRIRFVADATVKHHQGASTRNMSEDFGNSIWNANRISFYRKHHGIVGDIFVRSLLLVSVAKIAVALVASRRAWPEKRRLLTTLASFTRRSMAWPTA
jgi:N-acetylglucosaminyl-diphospho-decaprenol L-rhamnosyltransferase